MSIPANSSLVQYIENIIILFLVLYDHQKLSYEKFLSIPLSVFVIFYPVYKVLIHVLDIRSHSSLCKSIGH